MFIKTIPVGSFQCNCTILGCEKSGEALIIDPGDQAEDILAIVKKEGFRVKYLVHTHAHLDHIGVAGPLKRQGHGKIVLHREDEFIYDSLEEQGRMFGLDLEPRDTVDHEICHKDELEFGVHVLKVLHTPGHTPGSCSFLIKDKNLLFSGDTLFRRSIGRTDLPGGDSAQILDSIQNRIFTLDKDHTVIPGHGESTCLSEEKKLNPFLV